LVSYTIKLMVKILLSTH
ncbi:D-alanyl-D-alanine carboxypeptidase family protein, partial [Vibrio harveyi]